MVYVAPAKLVLRVEMAGVGANEWNIWVYPHGPAAATPPDITLATRWDAAAKEVLRQGGRLFLVPAAPEIQDAVPGTFTSVYWGLDFPAEQVSKTMGLLCDPATPALSEFPTDFYSDWQWWDPVMRSSAMRLDELPAALRPIVQVVDSFRENRRLAMVFEAKVGPGRLLVCSADIISDLRQRPVARQLRRSLLDYMAGPLFSPDVPVSEEELGKILVAR